MQHSTRKPTKTEQARLDALSRMPCICCENTMLAQPSKTEIHHIVDRGYRSHSGGHMSTIPLCEWHHQGICLDGLTARDMTNLYGPSLARNKRAFVALYGAERALLAIVDARLRVAA